MIDCENEVYDRVVKRLRAKYTDINTASEYINAPSSFPHISIEETDNYTLTDDQSNSSSEELARVAITINVYSNKTEGKKSEAKSIMRDTSDIMFAMNFNRESMTPVPNMADSSIYRITARFTAKTDGKYFYRG